MPSSAIPFPLPAALKGWQGQLPVQTGRLSGHPACWRAYDQTPIPAKKWHLGISHKLTWFDIFNAPFVHFAGRNMPLLYQLTQPSSRF
jgi:hypothetical protein